MSNHGEPEVPFGQFGALGKSVSISGSETVRLGSHLPNRPRKRNSRTRAEIWENLEILSPFCEQKHHISSSSPQVLSSYRPSTQPWVQRPHRFFFLSRTSPRPQPYKGLNISRDNRELQLRGSAPRTIDTAHHCLGVAAGPLLTGVNKTSHNAPISRPILGQTPCFLVLRELDALSRHPPPSTHHSDPSSRPRSTSNNCHSATDHNRSDDGKRERGAS